MPASPPRAQFIEGFDGIRMLPGKKLTAPMGMASKTREDLRTEVDRWSRLELEPGHCDVRVAPSSRVDPSAPGCQRGGRLTVRSPQSAS